MITDISDGGVKIVAEHLVPPPEFTLIFSTGEARECRLAWRIGCEFGAQYVGRVIPPRRAGVAA